ncbi:MAG: signal peptidase II [Bacteroidota bacterium]
MIKFKPLPLIKSVLIVSVIMANIGCDQVSKHLVRERMSDNQNISLLYNHFTLIKVENTGAFLSLGDSIPGPVKFVLLTLLPLVILIGAVVYLIIKRKHIALIPLIAACFVVGGGIGNVYDRLLYSSVTDFMHIRFGFLQTGIFNMADVSVTVGVLMVFVYFYIMGRKDNASSSVHA